MQTEVLITARTENLARLNDLGSQAVTVIVVVRALAGLNEFRRDSQQ
jgi:hypothetical protein